MAIGKTVRVRRVLRPRSASKNVDGLKSNTSETITEVSVKRANQKGSSICHSRKDDEGDEWIICGSCMVGPIKAILGFICAVCDAKVVTYKMIPYYPGGYP